MFNGNHQIRTSWQIMIASVYTLTIRNLELRFIMKGSNKRLIDLLIIFFEPVGHVLLWSAIKLFKYPPEYSPYVSSIITYSELYISPILLI